ncbi:hypothetical protein [Gimesia aquarii]|uniref:Uncharacterized protein n=1 Tax=Gimesia aquarii TaxID=2527964 RepID=A0A517WW29_9PLAN|nr:hypothetical protein [Gimesia aquarii]QDU09475.1 hypothetical protein V202x_28500 [Gimesia aquarii]
MRRWEITLVKSGRFDSELIHAYDESAARNYAKRHFVKHGWTISSVRESNEFANLKVRKES